MFLGLDGERRFSLLLHDTMTWIYLVGNVIAIFYSSTVMVEEEMDRLGGERRRDERKVAAAALSHVCLSTVST